MNQPPNNAPLPEKVQQGSKLRWTLIPVLTFVGWLSGGFTIWYITPPTDLWESKSSAVRFLESISFGRVPVLLGSISIGLAILAVLWLYGLVRTWKVFAAALVVTVAVHYLQDFLENNLGVFLSSFVAAFILYVTFLLLVKPKRGVVRVVLFALICSWLLGLMVTGRYDHGFFPEVKWQTMLALFLAIALMLKWAHFPNDPSPADSESRVPFIRRFAALGPLVLYVAIIVRWYNSEFARYAGHRLRE